MGEEAAVKCPKCGSTQFTAVKKGFSLGKAAVGAVLLGPIGLVGGAHGANRVEVVCLKCGKRWTPGKR
jgi:tellurium resistance protein TerD